MKKSTIALVEKKFMNDIYKINDQIRANKREIKKLAEQQKA